MIALRKETNVHLFNSIIASFLKLKMQNNFIIPNIIGEKPFTKHLLLKLNYRY